MRLVENINVKESIILQVTCFFNRHHEKCPGCHGQHLYSREDGLHTSLRIQSNISTGENSAYSTWLICSVQL